MFININGRFYTKDRAKVSVMDRGFLYGDGIFETMRSYNGKIFALDEHIKRLRNSANIILLKISRTDEEIKNELIRTLKKNKLKNAILRMSFSHGNGWALNIKDGLKPTMVILCRAFHPYPEEFYKKGVDIIISKKVISYSGSVLNHVKSTNYIPNILAKNEADDAGAFDALTLDEKGYILEGSVSNFFIVKKGVLITAPLTTGILPGVTRGIVLKLAKRLCIRIEEKIFKPDLICKADEAFLTNTSAGILPVKKVNDIMIFSGSPGKITLKLFNKFRDEIKERSYDKFKK